MKAISDQFTTILPDELFEGVLTIISYFGYMNGVFPIDTLFFCLGVLCSFYIAWYTYKIAMWVWSMLPYIGKSEANQVPEGNVLNLHKGSSNARILDLRRGRAGKGKVTMKDIQ